MRPLTLALPLALLIAGCGLLDNPRDGFDRIGSGPEICGPAGSSELFLSSGLLESATHVDCTPPAASSSVNARFSDVSGQESAVNGGSVAMDWSWAGAESLDGRMALLAIDGEDGYFAMPLADLANPLPAELFIRQGAAGGLYTIAIAIDDGSGAIVGPPVFDEETGEELGTPPAITVGEWLEFQIEVLQVQGGDIQISASWNTDTDLDLYVVDPDGSEIFYGNPTAPSGGELDLDSNAGCSPGPRLENVYWPSAPSGVYEVRLNYWSNCEYAGETDWRVTIVLDGTDIEVHSGSFTPLDVDPGGEGAGQVVTLFSF